MTFDATEQLLATLDREGSLRLWDLHQECGTNWASILTLSNAHSWTYQR
jgi:hypothetical protein